ncbi:MAG: hypothetical protein L0Y72_32060 [Gemmataceae bacterium]|nr:hypothetical protein [Gemmataceae bacterium]
MHVRAAGSRAVAHGLEQLLPRCGYDLHQTGRRKVWIAEARNGWVGLLMSSLEDSVDLAGPLSAELQTDVLHVFVNDSDSWHYQTFRNGALIDDFDSLGDLHPAGELQPTAIVEQRVRGGGGKALGQALRGHVERLRSFLSPSAYEEQVRAILGEQGAFAEETLARFLPLVGVASVYAHLSYRYLDEFSKDELVKQGVRLVKHLRFQKRRRRS